jgi:hypothetical protein
LSQRVRLAYKGEDRFFVPHRKLKARRRLANPWSSDDEHALGNRGHPPGLSGMPDLKSQITEEIATVRSAIDDAKHIIKKNTAKGLGLNEPELTLRELRTRLGVLESNLEKVEASA